jgi:hypothetical protein
MINGRGIVCLNQASFRDDPEKNLLKTPEFNLATMGALKDSRFFSR